MRCTEWEEEKEEPTLVAFLEELTLRTSGDEVSAGDEAVRLMTLHNGKGLEFSLVFIVGMEEDLFPHINAKENPASLEEERRLCYVGMTRAQRKLYLTYSDTRRLHGHENLQRPSRFLREIPEKFFSPSSRKLNVRKPMSVHPKQSFSNSRTNYVEQKSEPRKPGELYLGQNVSHKKFGQGIITNIEGNGSTARIQVKFNRVGSKWLVAEFANLETV